jgi:hypothetical protein
VSESPPEFPRRWDLVRPDQLGTLLDGVPAPSLPFVDELVTCSAKVVARSGGGDLVFLGRALDSMYDLLSGAFDGLDAAERLQRLPLSQVLWWYGEPGEARAVLTRAGLAPSALQRRRRPVTFVDVVSGGLTYHALFALIYTWVADDGAQWDVVRRKLRFVGVTDRRPTSPRTHRWQQHVDWPRELPGGAVVNVSMDAGLYSYLADRQDKTTPSFWPSAVMALFPRPQRRREDLRRKALAEAVALVEHGRRRATRQALARVMSKEPAMTESWLRTLVTALNR